jgi:CubicO group peptidase (beta-lactamase class C family)
MKCLTVGVIALLAFYIAMSQPVYGQSAVLDQKGLEMKFDETVPVWLDEFIVPGAAVAMIENGELRFAKGYGMADESEQIPVTKTTGFNIASISKTVSAWGVMKLVEEGKLKLDEPASTYLTRWELPASEFDASGVTIRRLLSHTAGLSLHGYPGWTLADTLPSIEESLSGKTNGAGDVRLIMEPGTRWQYSGGGYNAAVDHRGGDGAVLCRLHARGSAESAGHDQ